jgi:hypothetical protein
MTTTAPTRTFERSVTALTNRVVLPEHGNWDEARRAWNLAVDQQPAAVVFPESAQDVIATVELARAFGLRVTAQGTGHNAAPLEPLEETVLVKTERMRQIEINPEARIARIEAGVRSLELTEAAARHGLAPLSGSSPDVGVIGYTLGGGLSWFGRKYGLAASTVHAIELVTADGQLVRADHDHEPDLFWALRGGGGSFGIVTALELLLIPISEVYAGVLWWPIERDEEVLHAWADLTRRELPDELTTVGRYLRLPPLPDIPETSTREVVRRRRGDPPRRARTGRRAARPAPCARPRHEHHPAHPDPGPHPHAHGPRTPRPRKRRRHAPRNTPTRSTRRDHPDRRRDLVVTARFP